MSSNIFLKPLDIAKKTKNYLIYSSLLHEMFISFFCLMPFILRKELKATAFQISLFTMLKPAVSFFSFYWSMRIKPNVKSLKSNLIIAGILARIPFLFLGFFNNIWYLVFASSIYMIFSRASIPAWMEILKLNLSKKSRERLFSISSILSYVEGVFIALLIGYFLDAYSQGWKVVFFISTIFGFLGVFLQGKTPVFDKEIVNENKPRFNPLKEGIELIKKRKDFAHYQMGSMICGFGFMLAIPALSIFYADNLQLTHMQMTIGRFIFMGFGYVVFSLIWARLMNRFFINNLLGFICIGFGIFPIFIFLALFDKIWFYIAFLSYGITQGGSHLIWNLSGPFFARKEDSSKFTAINVLMIGIRGLIAPLLGGFLCNFISPVIIFFISFFICIFGSCVMFKRSYVLEEV